MESGKRLGYIYKIVLILRSGELLAGRLTGARWEAGEMALWTKLIAAEQGFGVGGEAGAGGSWLCCWCWQGW
jgi:hypothetical protein